MLGVGAQGGVIFDYGRRFGACKKVYRSSAHTFIALFSFRFSIAHPHAVVQSAPCGSDSPKDGTRWGGLGPMDPPPPCPTIGFIFVDQSRGSDSSSPLSGLFGLSRSTNLRHILPVMVV